MKTVYYSTSKNGKEIEGTFTTRKGAENDCATNEYYLAGVEVGEVTQEEFEEIELCAGEVRDEEWFDEGGEWFGEYNPS